MFTSGTQGSRQGLSTGGNISGCDFGLYRTKPGAKNEDKFAGLCGRTVVDWLEICRVKNHPRTGAPLVQCKNARRYGRQPNRLRRAGFTTSLHLHRDRLRSGHQLEGDLSVYLRTGHEKQRGGNVVEGHAGISQHGGKRHNRRQLGTVREFRPKDCYDCARGNGSIGVGRRSEASAVHHRVGWQCWGHCRPGGWSKPAPGQ